MKIDKNSQDYNPENRFLLRWRHIAAYIYLAICVFDFILMPVVFENSNKISLVEAVRLSLLYEDIESQKAALLLFLEKRSWEPITLFGGGVFHASFGVILGFAAHFRNKEKEYNYSDYQNRRNNNRGNNRSRVDNPDA